MKGNNKKQKGFTLIELLVVIAIIAILSVVVILTLNPAELLRQSRDSNRISDLSVTKSGIAFYLASVSSGINIGSSTFCYIDASGLTLNNNQEGTSTCGWFVTATSSMVSTTVANYTKVDGTGWIPINFNAITAGGSPLGSLPHDPTNNDEVQY
jgi:prepilin-type N-terminal cleavage/methylation domain-containing protein